MRVPLILLGVIVGLIVAAILGSFGQIPPTLVAVLLGATIAAAAALATLYTRVHQPIMRLRTRSCAWRDDSDVVVPAEIGAYLEFLERTTVDREEIARADATAAETADVSRRSAIGQLESASDRILSGDYGVRLRESFDDEELRGLAGRVDQIADRMKHMGTRVHEIGTQIDTAAGEILSVVTQNTAATAEQAASVSQTLVTVDQLRDFTRGVVDRASLLQQQAESAGEESTTGSGAVNEVVSVMSVIRERVDEIATDIRRLSEQTHAIESITQSVNDIADQSNMLALNATIEAARAGEQGRGFAVVAQEVRTLAEQSKTATAQVQAILAEIQNATVAASRATQEGITAVGDGIERARRAGDAISRIDGTIQDSATVFGEIAQSLREQQNGIDQIAQAMADVTGSSTQIAERADNARTTAEQLSTYSTRLTDVTGAWNEAASRAISTRTSDDDGQDSVANDVSGRLRHVSLDRLPRVLRDELGVECAVVVAFHDGLAVPIAQALPDGQRLMPFEPVGEGAIAAVYRTGASVRIDDYGRLSEDKVARVAMAGNYTASVATPIEVDGAVWGAVLAATRAGNPLPRGAEGLLREASARVAAQAADLLQDTVATEAVG